MTFLKIPRPQFPHFLSKKWMSTYDRKNDLHKTERGRKRKSGSPQPGPDPGRTADTSPSLPTHPCLGKRLAEPQPHPAWSVFELDLAPVVV